MKTIYKYVLSPFQRTVPMPFRSRILSCQAQGLDICLWCEVDTTEPSILRTFDIIGTGWDLDEYPLTKVYVGTVQLSTGLVFHIYEV